jgi:PAS domain S-box-containing protein
MSESHVSEKKYRILIVDDSEEDRETYRFLLCHNKECDYSFDEAELVSEGIGKALSEPFDCILLDYMLPDSDGLEFLKRLKTAGGINVPVVMVTGQGNEGIAVQALRLGAHDYLVKSQITAESIFRATRNAIEKHTQQIRLDVEAEKTKALQEQLSLLIDGTSDHALILLDKHGKITTWNSGGLAVTGYQEAEVLHQHIDILFPDMDRVQGAAEQELRQAELLERIDLERWLLRKDGAMFWASGSVSALRYPDGSMRGYAKIIRDDTAKKHLLDEQANGQKWLENLLNVIPAAFVLIEKRSGKTLFANECAHLLAGGAFPYSDKTSEYASKYPLLDTNGQPVPLERHPWAMAVWGADLNSALSAWATETGKTYVLATSKLLPTLFGREPVLILSLQDITQLKHVQRQLLEAKTEAEAATVAKGTFLANMSHELRTPLNTILGFAELSAREDAPLASRKRFAEVVKRNGDALIQLIDDVLDLAKIEAGRLNAELGIVDIQQLIQDIFDAYAIKAGQKGLQLEAQSAPDVPASIHTDPLRLRQILYNMIGNALKFTDRGQVLLNIQLRPTSARDDRCHERDIVFSVADTGIGISKESQQRLFQPFTQADSSTTRKYGGTGLGLILCLRLAAALGGRFTLAQSTPGVGSIFELVLPLQRHQNSPLDEQDTLEVKSPGVSSASLLRDADILLVEDSTDTRFLFQEILEYSGARVTTAVNGLDALRLASIKEFELIMMDIQMPVMDGYTAAKKLRESGYECPIVGVSANVFMEDREKSLAAGMDEHVNKPIHADLLRETLGAQLQRHRSRKARDASIDPDDTSGATSL